MSVEKDDKITKSQDTLEITEEEQKRYNQTKEYWSKNVDWWNTSDDKTTAFVNLNVATSSASVPSNAKSSASVPSTTNQKGDSFTPFMNNNFKTHCVLISQLLSEVWLGTPRGKTFRENINSGMELREALKVADIETIPENWLDYELDTSTYDGRIVPKEILKEGLHFVWYIPYAPCPSGRSMRMKDVRDWVYETIPKWLEDEKKNQKMQEKMQEYSPPTHPFPKPPNPYIPLATT